MAREEKGSVEGLKSKLYSRKSAPDISPEDRTPLSHSSAEAPKTWQDANQPPVPPAPSAPFSPQSNKNPRMSFATKFFIGSVVFFIVAAASAAYMFFVGGNTISPRNIDVSVVAPSVIDSGKKATIEILINNRNKTALQLVDMIIDYPDGTRDPNNAAQALSYVRESIGTISSGEQIKRTADAVFYGQEGIPQKVTVTLEYSVTGSNAIFEKTGEAEFIIGSSPVSISIDSPSEIISGQPFSVNLNVTSNATTPLENLVIQGQYPFGFSVIDASPSADAGGTLWRLGTIAPGSTRKIRLTGSIDGQDGDQCVFRFLAGQDADQTNTSVKVPFLTVPQTVTVQRPFITATVAINNQTGKSVAVSAGQSVQGVITWQNNLSDTVTNAEIRLFLSGPMLDKSSITSSNGFYQSSNSTITWTKDQDASLASIPPGSTGTLSFSFATVAPGVSGTIYANPTVDLGVVVTGVRPGQDNVPSSVSSAAQMQVTLASLVTLGAQALHAQGIFPNTGPTPPKVEQKTTYTIVWTAKNSSNAVANAVMSATLPLYVSFLQAEAGSGVTYDPSSRTVSWNLGDLKAGVGYNLPTRSASFQIELFPSSSQVGQAPALTGTPTLAGEDRFAQTRVQASTEAPTTATIRDSGFSSGGVVAPN